jgi:hypothetical protein
VRPLLTVTVAVFCFATPLLAQSPPTTSAPAAAKQSDAASSPAKSVGMFAYPKNQQNGDQQLKDENECFASSKQQSGIDPPAPPPAAKTEEQKKAEHQAAADNAKQARGGRVQQQQEAQTQAAYQQGIDKFKRSFSARMESRSYSIK